MVGQGRSAAPEDAGDPASGSGRDEQFTVALTGGIGSGKSEVLRRFAAYGATVVDADLAARAVVEPGTDGYEEVVEEFGPGVVGPDGALDRAALGALVFSDDARRARLNAIVHPRVGALMAQWAATAPPGAVVIYDIPLLVEGGARRGHAAIVVVDADEDVRFERLRENRGMDRAAAAARMAAQASREERLAVADYVVENNGSMEDLDRETRRVWDELVHRRDNRIR